MLSFVIQSIAVVLLLLTLALQGIAAPLPRVNEDRPVEEPSRWIDASLRAAWQKHQLTPAGRTSDEEFIRRTSLDIIGRIATPEEVRRFTSDSKEDKRIRLINALQRNAEYSRYWASLWTGWLLRSTAHPDHQSQLRLWLEKEFNRGISHRQMVEKLLTATGKSSVNGAAAFIVANRGTLNPSDRRIEDGQHDMIPLTSRAGRLFTGLAINCVRCHDHPFNPSWKERHFRGMNAFFLQVEYEGADRPETEKVSGPADFSVRDNPKLNPSEMVFSRDRRGWGGASRASFLDGKKFDHRLKTTRREQFAGFTVNHEMFAQAYVNRIWGQFFGRSMTTNDVVDDFGEHNEVVHTELLDRLAKEFIRTGYDPRRLVHWICNSEAYQLRCVRNPTNAAAEADVYFSRMLLKPMNDEQRFASLWIAAHGSPGLADVKRNQLHSQWIKARADERFDRDWDEGHFENGGYRGLPNSDSIMQLNNCFFQEAIPERLARLSQRAKPAQVMDELFLTMLNRLPNETERAELMKIIEAKPLGPSADLKPLWNDLFWVLLNNSEFLVNH